VKSVVEEIQATVDHETRAWDEQDAETLVALFHPDMAWPWPPDANTGLLNYGSVAGSGGAPPASC